MKIIASAFLALCFLLTIAVADDKDPQFKSDSPAIAFTGIWVLQMGDGSTFISVGLKNTSGAPIRAFRANVVKSNDFGEGKALLGLEFSSESVYIRDRNTGKESDHTMQPGEKMFYNMLATGHEVQKFFTTEGSYIRWTILAQSHSESKTNEAEKSLLGDSRCSLQVTQVVAAGKSTGASSQDVAPRDSDQPQGAEASSKHGKISELPSTDSMHQKLDAVLKQSAEVDRRAAARQQAAPEQSATETSAATPTPRRPPEKTWDKPHIYLHIADESQHKLAETIKQRLTKEGWVVMGIENVATSPYVPETQPELRYFTSDDSEESQEIDSKIRPLLGDAEINHNIPESGGYVSHSRQYEFWFSRSFGKDAKQGPLKAEQIASLDLPHVQTAIDEIYAQHGAEFPKHETQVWADRQSWYHRVPGLSPDAAEQTFSADERSNIELLAARRSALKAPPRK